MNPREQKLAYILLGAMVLIAGGVGGYQFILQPYRQLGAEEANLSKEIEDLESGAKAHQATVAKMAEYKRRSLPVHPTDKTFAQTQYSYRLTQLLTAAGASGDNISIQPQPVDNTARYVPEISKGRPVYTRVAYVVTIKKADMWVVRDFLQAYYDLGLLHQVTHLSIKRDDDASGKAAGRRDDLTVVLTTEALLIDGAETRRTLLPVPAAFAAAGGAALYRGMTVTPEGGRGVAQFPHVQVLAAAPRDYSLLVFRDPFNGPLTVPPPFKIDPIKDVKFVEDAAPPAVKVGLSGEGAVGASIKISESGKLFGSGLKVDPKTGAITLPKPSGAGTSTVTVVARSVEGIETSTTFKVSVEKKPPPPPTPPTPVAEDKRPDVSASIILIGATPRSDGTAWARVRDNANRLRYNIDYQYNTKTGKKELVVVKEWFVLEWKKDKDHDQPAGVLHISDDSVKTDRLFRVVAILPDGLVVADLRAGAPAPAAPKPGGKGPRPGPPPAPKGHPIAAVGGNMAAAAVPTVKYYLWPVGASLADLQPLPDSDVKKILKSVSEKGPVLTELAAGN